MPCTSCPTEDLAFARRRSRSARPQRPIWRTAYGPDPSTPNSLCALIRFDFRFNGLPRLPTLIAIVVAMAIANHRIDAALMPDRRIDVASTDDTRDYGTHCRAGQPSRRPNRVKSGLHRWVHRTSRSTAARSKRRETPVHRGAQHHGKTFPRVPAELAGNPSPAADGPYDRVNTPALLRGGCLPSQAFAGRRGAKIVRVGNAGNAERCVQWIV